MDSRDLYCMQRKYKIYAYNQRLSIFTVGIDMSFNFFLNIIYRYSYQGLMVLLAAEFLGMPIPGEPLLTFIGFKSAGNSLYFYKALIFGISGTFLGSMIAYFIGKRIGINFFEKYAKYIFIDKSKVLKVEKWMNKKYHYIVIIMISRYIPGIRHIVPYLSGICDLRAKNYAFWNIISSCIWCSSFIIGGRLLGKNWYILEGLFREYIIEILILIFIIFLIYYILIKVFFSKKKYQ